MHLIWVKVGGLWPANTGGRLRSLALIQELAQRHRITLLTTHGRHEDPDGLQAHLGPGVEVVSIAHEIPKRTSRTFPLALARSWLTSDPVDLWRCRIPALRAALDDRLRRDTPDLCIADFLAAVPTVTFGGPVPVVVFSHNVEHMIWQRLAATASNRITRGLLALEWRKMRRREVDACRRATLTLTVSDPDRDRLAALAPSAHIQSIPTGVDLGYFTPRSTDQDPDALVFVGSMDWYPNEDGTLDFMATTLPLIRRARPSTSFTIVGRNPSARLREAAAAAGAAVTGTVDDVRPFLERAAVAVVPLRVGGGTRIKIFEALAMGKALVSTTIGAEGLPLTPGTHYLQADQPEAFADHVLGLLRDPAARLALGQTGRQLVHQHYSWTHAAHVFESACEEVVTRASKRSRTRIRWMRDGRLPGESRS
ncbi:MAG TPA: glycosyltransferase family 4 protein [Vicinamibacterales bacterium]|jgi:glycosyltransferase involved in cell wall biosynthesis